MKISREEVNRIATLARLSLGEAEAEAMTRQLDAILEYVAQLENLDTKGVEPTAQVGESRSEAEPSDEGGARREAEWPTKGGSQTPMRDDEPQPSLSQEAALANAPKSAGGAFVVPKTVDVGN